MAVKKIINTWDGGHAQDLRTFSNDESKTSANFDIHTYPHSLISMRDMVAETYSGGTITDFDITDVVPIQISGTVELIGWGRESSASTKASFFKKTSSTDITSAWDKVATNAGAATPMPGTLVNYHNVAWAVDSVHNLVKFTSPATYTAVGTILATPGISVPKPFVHPEDDILYFGAGNIVGLNDDGGSGFDGSVLVLPENMFITSFTAYGSYLAIACKPANGAGESVVYLWDRDTSLNTGIQPIWWGDTALEVLENIGEILVGVSGIKNVGSFTAPTTTQSYKYLVRIYGGGSVQTVKEIVFSDSSQLRNFKAKLNDKLYFGFDTQDCVYVTGKNKSGEWFVAKSSFITPSGSYITDALTGISIVGDVFFISYTDGGTSGYLTRTTEGTYANVCRYYTTINPGMPVEDRYEEKTLVAVQIAYKCTGAGNMEVSLYVDSTFSLQQIIDSTNAVTGEYIQTSQMVTDGTMFKTGREFSFQINATGNMEVKEWKYIYEKMNTI